MFLDRVEVYGVGHAVRVVHVVRQALARPRSGDAGPGTRTACEAEGLAANFGNDKAVAGNLVKRFDGSEIFHGIMSSWPRESLAADGRYRVGDEILLGADIYYELVFILRLTIIYSESALLSFRKRPTCKWLPVEIDGFWR